MAKDKSLFSKENLDLFGREYAKMLTIFLKQSGKKATGALINSIDYRLKEDAEGIQLLIEANDYLEYVDKGRKPGSYPPISEISKWASIKGIPQEAVWPIAHKIFKFGIEPTNVIDKTVNSIMTNSRLNQKMEDELVKNVEQIIFDKLKQN